MRRGGKSTDDKYTHIRWSEAFTQGLFLRILLLFASFVRGCAGSAGGGIKVIRLR